MTENKEYLLEQIIDKFVYMHAIKNIQCSCGICHKTITYDLNTTSISKNEIAENLVNSGWLIVNNTLYCPECYEQYNILNNISKNNLRPNKINYYLNIAKEVSTRSTCLRRKYGAVLIKNDIIIATGYNGSPRGTKNCIDLGECRREKLNIPRGQCYEMCRSIHAEQNCIINASRNDMIDSDLYLYGMDVSTNKIVYDLDSCQLCKKMIINAGIKRVIFARPDNNYEIKNVSEWVVNDETLTDKFGY